jgi:26S proteasome regulatory subunit N5
MQIYVEIERARLTRTLAKIKEEQGEIAEAASILQELQVRSVHSRC